MGKGMTRRALSLPLETGEVASETSSTLKAFRVLEVLVRARRAVTLSELMQATELPKPTLHRTLALFEEAGFLSREPGGRAYLIGERLQRFTERTLTDRAVLESELARIVSVGYAVDNEEYVLGVACVAVPVRNRRDEVIAAVAVQGATARLPLMRAIEFVPRLRVAAAEIGSTFG